MKQDKKKEANVPNLRFSEFQGEWEEYILEDIVENVKDRMPSSLLMDNNYISTENLLQDFQGITQATSIPSNVNVISFKENDVLLSNIRPYLKKVWKANIKGGCSADIFVFRSKPTCIPDFLYYLIANDNFINYVMAGSKGVKMPRGDKQHISQYNLFLPDKLEQNKIATFLSLLDKRIATQNKIIEQLETLIKGVCQKLADNKQWKIQYLRDILTERKETNKNNLPIFSVSVSKGVINQIEYLGRSFAAKNTANYNVVHFGDVVYTKSPTGEFPYGILKQSFIKENVAVSPLYGVYIPKDIHIGSILHYYFNSPINANNYLHSLVQKGAKNTINITNQRFLDNAIFLPTDKKEIEKTASLLNSINQKNQTEKAILEQFEKQKKYLLQQIFT